MNDLRVTPQEATPSAPNGVPTLGMGVVDSANRLADSVREGEWTDLSTYGHGALVALDALGVALDPLGSAVKAAVGWLLRHIAFLREPIEFLTGDPNVVRALSDTWRNIGVALAGAADDYTKLLKGVENWSGNAADAYRSLATSYAAGLHGYASSASNLSSGIRVAAVAVATTRGMVFEIIANWVSGVVKRAVAAAAASWFTAGSSIALFITSTVADAALLLAKVTKMIRRLLDMLRKFTDKFGTLRKGADNLDNALRRAQRNLGDFAETKRWQAGNPEKIVQASKDERQRQDTLRGKLAPINDAVGAGNGVPKEAAKQANREMDRQPPPPPTE